MKPHILIVLRQPPGERRVPHWQEALDDKAGTEAPLTPAIGELLGRHGVATFTTREYAPAGADWSREELAAQLDRVFRLVLRDSHVIPPALIRDLKLLPEVAEARPSLIGAAPLPEVSSAASAGLSQAHRAIRLPDAHRLTSGDPEIVIAVLDTGIDLRHREFGDRLTRAADFVDIIDGAQEFVGDCLGADDDPSDDVGHGTHVAAIAAGAGIGMAVGVAPRCRIMPVRVLAAMESEGRRVGAGLIDNINAGMKYAVDKGAHVINMSLGVRRAGGGLPHEQVTRYALEKNVTIVAAAGNDGRENLYYPGALPGVVAVGSVGEDDGVSPFSTYGPHVTVTAPGENIHSAQPGGGYGFATGTSHAAPFVSGVAALIQALARAAGETMPAKTVRRIFRDSSDRADRHFRTRRGGFGRLNAYDALRLAQLELN